MSISVPAPVQPIPAATVVVMRDRPGAAPELLMVERARTMAFAGGALVFPGGRVDPGDHALAARLGGDGADMAARIAAIRETIEEAGVALGLAGAADAMALQAGLHAGAALDVLLAEAGLTLDVAALVPFARWLPHHAPARVFDTRFYLARLPEGAPDPVVDASENVRVFWQSAQGVLDATARGEARVIFPTRRNLERLALFAGFEDAAAHARAHPLRTITPWVERRDDADYLCIPEDLGYPVTRERLDLAERG